MNRSDEELWIEYFKEIERYSEFYFPNQKFWFYQDIKMAKTIQRRVCDFSEQILLPGCSYLRWNSLFQVI